MRPARCEWSRAPGRLPRVNARVWGTVAAVVALSGIGVAPSEARSAPPRPMAQCSLPNVATGTRTCSYTFVHNDTIETFVVPATTKGPIQITAVGAPGFGEDATKSHGAKVTGNIEGPGGEPISINDGKIDGDKITFSVQYNGSTISHTGTISDDGIKIATAGGEIGPGDPHERARATSRGLGSPCNHRR